MEIEIKAERRIEDGMHYGRISTINYRTEPYAYTDLVIELEDKSTITAGYPTILTENSKLGQLFKRFGYTLNIGHKLDPDQCFVMQACQFQTITEIKGEKRFPKVITESVKPQQQIPPAAEPIAPNPFQAPAEPQKQVL